ncbi:hypothetical protein GQR36_22240 [Enterococcus termitis]
MIDTLRGIQLPLGTPALVYGWLEGGLPILLVQFLLIIVQILLWLPFFKAADKQATFEEKLNEEKENSIAEI